MRRFCCFQGQRSRVGFIFSPRVTVATDKMCPNYSTERKRKRKRMQEQAQAHPGMERNKGAGGLAMPWAERRCARAPSVSGSARFFSGLGSASWKRRSTTQQRMEGERIPQLSRHVTSKLHVFFEMITLSKLHRFAPPIPCTGFPSLLRRQIPWDSETQTDVIGVELVTEVHCERCANYFPNLSIKLLAQQ